MQFVIQSSALPDWHLEPLVRAAEYYKIPVYNVGVVPFTETTTGLDLVDPTIPTVFYGSTRLVELIHHKHPEYSPGVWYDDTSFLSDYMCNPNMLNRGGQTATMEKLCGTAGIFKGKTARQTIFVRPLTGLKTFAGKPTTPSKLITFYEENKDTIPADTIVRLSPYQDIWAEWRFFIVDNEVITGSLYRENGLKNRPASEDILLIAQSIAQKGLPMPTCVMDLCLTPDGIYVVEFNSLNASGLYDCDPYKIMKAIIDLVNQKEG